MARRSTKTDPKKPEPLPPIHQEGWKAILDALPNGVIVVGTDFSVRWINPALRNDSGLDPAAAIGRKCHDLFPGPLCHGPECPLIRISTEKGPFTYDFGAHCKCAGRTQCIVTVTALREEGGAITGIVETFAYASLLKRVQAELFNSHERLRKAMGGIIQAMSLTIEKRDPYTAGHQRRVAKLCRAIGTRLGLDWECLQGLRMAAAIHDLGKIHVPAAILNKPGDLSEHEIAIIRQHAQTGYEILKEIDFPWPVARAIHQHHERLDGSGYPRGLKGDAIILEARILAVADVTEAIASFRPYRQALGMPAALDELRRYRGVQYDAEIVDICLDLVERNGFDFSSKAWQEQA